MSLYTIDINCDLGEGVGNEAELMPYISSCNLACGGHAGDETTIKQVIELARQNGVGVGAHPSFPDKEHFGRRKLDISWEDLKASLLEQIGRVEDACQQAGIALHHIKMHGALYNLCASEAEYAHEITSFLQKNYPKIPVYVPFNSEMERAAQSNLKLIFEAFADRNYESDGSLVSRTQNNALITDKNELITQVIRLVKQGEIKPVSGPVFNLKADTICVHGDTANAVELVQLIHQKLTEESIQIKAV